jgi:hypothetical protein
VKLDMIKVVLKVCVSVKEKVISIRYQTNFNIVYETILKHILESYFNSLMYKV